MSEGDGRWERATGELEQLGSTGSLSGVARVVQGSDVLLEVAVGSADRACGTPVRPTTRFALASMCKMFTAVAALDCVRRGELALDARVVDVLPAHRRPASLAPEMTVHHLLTHTSGLGDYAEEDEDQPGYVADYGSIWRDVPMYRMERVDDFLPLYADLPANNAPGAEFHYCNTGYVLLGAVVEEVAGEEFTALVTRRILEPLGMGETGYPRLDELPEGCATGYLPDTSPARSNIYSVPVRGGPDGGAYSSAVDIDRFLRAVWSGELLGQELRDLMHTAHALAGEDHTGQPIHMGYGIFLRSGGAFGHGGGDPGVETLGRMWPAQDLTAVVLCNGENMLDPAWTAIVSAVT
jgi:CubicO group peptidase (beta-lactamase class C family)